MNSYSATLAYDRGPLAAAHVVVAAGRHLPPFGSSRPNGSGPRFNSRPLLPRVAQDAVRPEPVGTLRILAADGEALSLKRLEFLLGRIPDVQLVGTAGNADEALRQIASLKPDIVLLQVELSGMNGFELVESLAGGSIPQIIFVTAFDEFATRAFEVGATDYIVKPLDLDRLTVAIGKARSALEAAEAQLRIAELRAVVDALRSERPAPPRKRDTEVWAQRRGSFVRVSAETIDWIEADRDYVHIHVGEDSYLLRETLSGLHKRLGADRFVRIRRSALVKADKIESIRRAGPSDFRVTLVGGRELRVGITFVKAVRQMLSSGAGALDTAAGPGGSRE